MNKMKNFWPFFIFIFSVLLFSQKPNDVQIHIRHLENLIDNHINSWKYKETEALKKEKAPLHGLEWKPLPSGKSIQAKVFSLQKEFQVPQAFSGVPVKGSKVILQCHFRGIGVYEGEFLINKKPHQSFQLKFGNHSSEIKKEFLLAHRAKPGENILLTFRFKNRGRLPLIQKKEVEPGTYFHFQSQFQIPETQKIHQRLSRLLLDMKTGAVLLELTPQKTDRPVSEEYSQRSSSRRFQILQKTLREAILNFDLDSVEEGDTPGVKHSVKKFHKQTKPISRFLQNYTLYAGGNSHIDLAWLWRWRETVEVSQKTFSTVMDHMEEYPHIVYIQSQAQVYKWMEKYYPQVFQRIQKKVKQGRWEIVGGMWAEPDCNLPDGESFIRQILYGKRYFQKKFGVDVKIGWNPDSFGYNWNIPQFYKKSGIHSFVTQKISWNDTTVFPYYLFWWEGLDGSRILSYFPPTGYVGRLKALPMTEGLKRFERNTGFKNMFVLYGLGDHGGGPNREMLNRAQGYQKQTLFPPIQHNQFSHYLKQVKKHNLKDLPVWDNELYLEYHRGTYTTQAETKKFNRKLEVLLSNAEKLSSLTSLYGEDYPQKNLEKAWKKVLMNQFHDILPGSSIHSVYKDAKESYLQAQKLAQNELSQKLLQLSQKIQTSTQTKGHPLLVFNPLSWKRNGVVKVKLPPELNPPVKILTHDGEEIPSQRVPLEKGTFLYFTAKNIPSVGYKIYKVQKGQRSFPSMKVNKNTLENRYFRVAIHPQSGNIISIFDKLENKEVLSPSAQGNQLQLFEDIPERWDAWNIHYTGRSWKLNEAKSVHVGKKGPVVSSVVVKKNFLGLSKAKRPPTENFPSSFFSQEIILYKDIPRIDIHMKADWWEDHVLMKVAFPVDVTNDQATYEIPFGYVHRPTTRKTPWEKARFEVPAIKWADLSEENYGVALLNNCKYGYDIKNNVMRLTLLRSPTSPDPIADRGKHQFAYALYPHQGDWKKGNTVQRGYEFNYPLLPLFVESHPGELPPSFSFVQSSPSNILLATIKKTEDRDNLIFRFYESEGNETQATIQLFRKPRRIFELDLMENRIQSVPFKGKNLYVNFKNSEIKSFEIIFQ
ncbi:alpha-mannosidase [bacterium]|nr:alpha-mannosidase [bacterium]